MSLTLLTTRPDVCLSSSTKASQLVPDSDRLGVSMKRATTHTPKAASNNSAQISAPPVGMGLDHK